MRDALTAHGDLHTADGAHTCARLGVVSAHMAKQGRRYDPYATAAGGLQGLQALSPRHWPPLGAFIKPPPLRVVPDSSLCPAERGGDHVYRLRRVADVACSLHRSCPAGG